MFLGIYRFEGKGEELGAAYDRLIATIPHEGLHLHICARGDQGLVIYDACPTREVFESFASSEQMRGAMASAGLPEPEIDLVGDVHSVFWNGERML
jgi:hypothetical protein